jgi:hypothetical protein
MDLFEGRCRIGRTGLRRRDDLFDVGQASSALGFGITVFENTNRIGHIGVSCSLLKVAIPQGVTDADKHERTKFR